MSRGEPLVGNLSSLGRFPHILIAGGTFDPFTQAHLEVPRQVAEAIGAQAILYVPAKHNPLKPKHALASDEDRLNMISAAIAEAGNSSQVELFVTGMELGREGLSYTADTLAELRSSVGDSRLSLFIGSDVVKQLHSWRSVEDILATVQLAIVLRGERKEDLMAAIGDKFDASVLDRIGAGVLSVGEGSVVSATAVREMIRCGVEVPAEFLPRGVAEYIADKRLYR